MTTIKEQSGDEIPTTGATLGLALMASAAPGWAADEQEPADPGQSQLRRPGAEHPQRGETDQGPGGASGLFEGQSLTLTTPATSTRGKHEGQLPPSAFLQAGGGPSIHQRNAWVQGTVKQLTPRQHRLRLRRRSLQRDRPGAQAGASAAAATGPLANSDGEAIGEWSKLPHPPARLEHRIQGRSLPGQHPVFSYIDNRALPSSFTGFLP